MKHQHLLPLNTYNTGEVLIYTDCLPWFMATIDEDQTKTRNNEVSLTVTAPLNSGKKEGENVHLYPEKPAGLVIGHTYCDKCGRLVGVTLAGASQPVLYNYTLYHKDGYPSNDVIDRCVDCDRKHEKPGEEYEEVNLGGVQRT